MTTTEFHDLFDSLCYGHDAELTINNQDVFLEWNGEKIEIFHITAGNGKKIGDVCEGEKIATVRALFGMPILGQYLNSDYRKISVVDIE